MEKFAKFMALFIVFSAITAIFCGCNSTTTKDTTTSSITTTTEPVATITKEAVVNVMIDMYQKDLWQGQIMESPNMPGYKYSIKNGVLYENGESLNVYPDIVIGDVSFKGGRFLGPAPQADGILITDGNYSTIARFYKGKLINAGNLFDEDMPQINYRAKFFVKDRFVVVQYGQHLRIYDYLNEWTVESRDDTIDVVKDGDEIKISTFTHDNFVMDNGGLRQIATHYTKFPTDKDLTMVGIPMSDQKGLRPEGRVFYAGFGADEKYYYLYSNDSETYTLVYRDEDSGTVGVLAKNVTDAEGTIGGCYFIEDGKVYYIGKGANKKLIYDGTAYAITPFWSEDDAICIVTTENEANIHNSNGWENLMNPALIN